MTDSYSDPQNRDKNSVGSREGRRAGGFKTGRGPGNREGGGFKIRLSDNEMRSARSLQDAFNLRSTVAVLGFSLRTLGQMLEEGKLDDLITQYRSQPQHKPDKREDGSNWSRKGRFSTERTDSRQGENRPDPFARPEKPKPKVSQTEEQTSSAEEVSNGETETPQAESLINNSPSIEDLDQSSEASVDTEVQGEQPSKTKEE